MKGADLRVPVDKKIQKSIKSSYQQQATTKWFSREKQIQKQGFQRIN